MAERHPPRTPPSAPDGEGVRVIRKPGMAPRVRPWTLLAAIAVAAAVAWFALAPRQDVDAKAAPVAVAGEATATAHASPRSAVAATAMPLEEPPSMPGNDPNDLAAHFRPGDPEPTGAEVIEALQHAGVRTGLGAFNPPGTSPPLVGLAVPDDFQLPPGYVRHHQVTDAGVPIQPILMFSPDFVLYDANGKPIAMPANRVVPPALAPAGLPLRPVRIPPPKD